MIATENKIASAVSDRATAYKNLARHHSATLAAAPRVLLAGAIAMIASIVHAAPGMNS